MGEQVAAGTLIKKNTGNGRSAAFNKRMPGKRYPEMRLHSLREGL